MVAGHKQQQSEGNARFRQAPKPAIKLRLTSSNSSCETSDQSSPPLPAPATSGTPRPPAPAASAPPSPPRPPQSISPPRLIPACRIPAPMAAFGTKRQRHASPEKPAKRRRRESPPRASPPSVPGVPVLTVLPSTPFSSPTPSNSVKSQENSLPSPPSQLSPSSALSPPDRPALFNDSPLSPSLTSTSQPRSSFILVCPSGEFSSTAVSPLSTPSSSAKTSPPQSPPVGSPSFQSFNYSNINLIHLEEILSTTRQRGRAISERGTRQSHRWELVGESVPYRVEGLGVAFRAWRVSYDGHVWRGVLLIELPAEYQCPTDQSPCPFGCGIGNGSVRFKYTK